MPVAPSLIETDMVRSGLASSAARIPLGRFGTPEECAQVVMMLVGNAYMTGQTVALSGGMSFLPDSSPPHSDGGCRVIRRRRGVMNHNWIMTPPSA